MLKKSFPNRLFFIWLIYIGALSFIVYLSWHLQFLQKLFIHDPTKLTYLISLFFLGGTLHCGIRAYYLSKQINSIEAISTNRLSWETANSLPAKFLQTIADSLIKVDPKKETEQETDKQLLTDVFSLEVRGQHEIGWFITGLLVKLGLLGTVIGFVLMLQPLASLESFEISDIQSVLVSMTSGMSVALNTTLLGLISSMLLSFQYLLLDRGADELIARTVHFMQTSFFTQFKESIQTK